MSEAGQYWMSKSVVSVANGSAAMSQRRQSSIGRNGGVAAAVAAARARGVHLVKLTDDEGIVLISASLHPFEPLC